MWCLISTPGQVGVLSAVTEQAPVVVLYTDDVMIFAHSNVRVCPYRMDVEANAGRDSTWRGAGQPGDAGGGDGGGTEVQVVPLELYDSARAKIAANLCWLFAKAYGIGKAYSVFYFSSNYVIFWGCLLHLFNFYLASTVFNACTSLIRKYVLSLKTKKKTAFVLAIAFCCFHFFLSPTFFCYMR